MNSYKPKKLGVFDKIKNIFSFKKKNLNKSYISNKSNAPLSIQNKIMDFTKTPLVK